MIILEDNFNISKEDYDKDNIYIQWKCDPHHPCEDIANDHGYCPTGCSFAPLSNISKLKFGVTSKGRGRNNVQCCACEATDCHHSITSADFYNLKLHQAVVGLWPFNSNHFYEGRIVKMVTVDSFPSKEERSSLELLKVNQNPTRTSAGKYIAFNETYGSVYLN